jgi:hypothetical protein
MFKAGWFIKFSFMLAANNLSIFCLMYETWIVVVPTRFFCANITCNFLMW